MAMASSPEKNDYLFLSSDGGSKSRNISHAPVWRACKDVQRYHLYW